MAALAIVMQFTADVRLGESAVIPFQIVIVILAGIMLLVRRDAARFAALAVVAFIVTGVWQPGLRIIETTRSFFGVHRVVETPNGAFRILHHGTTIHGAEKMREADGTATAGRPEPLTYYYFGGPISEGVALARTEQRGLHNVAVVGLGAGSLACHAESGENWKFFEIDPEVVRLARDPNVFHFMSACAPHAETVLGDARLTLTRSSRLFDLIVLDAFSSDAIPVHLLTREALRGYLARLSPRGVILMHISNRHMELAQVVAAVGAAEGLVAVEKVDGKAHDFTADFRSKAHVAVLARDESQLQPLMHAGWQRLAPSQVAAWTDDYADIMGAIFRKKLGR